MIIRHCILHWIIMLSQWVCGIIIHHFKQSKKNHFAAWSVNVHNDSIRSRYVLSSKTISTLTITDNLKWFSFKPCFLHLKMMKHWSLKLREERQVFHLWGLWFKTGSVWAKASMILLPVLLQVFQESNNYNKLKILQNM